MEFFRNIGTAEQNEAYQLITSSMRNETEAVTRALKLLFNTFLTKTITVSVSQPMSWKLQNGWLWHQWLSLVLASSLQQPV